MERRVLIAVFLSFLVLYAYQALFVKPEPPAARSGAGARPPITTPQSSPERQARGPSGVAVAPLSVPKETTQPRQTLPAAVRIGDHSDRTVTVETDVVRAVFANRGAHLVSWELKRYADEAGRPFEMIPRNLPAGTPLPFMVRVKDEESTAALNSVLFLPSASSLEVRGTQATLTFRYDDGRLVAEKKFTFEPASYLLRAEISVEREGQVAPVTVLWGPGLGNPSAEQEKSSYFIRSRGVVFLDRSPQRLDEKAVAAQPGYEGSFAWAGVEEQYFMSIGLLDNKPARVEFEPLHLDLSEQQGKRTRVLMSYGVRPEAQPATVDLFVGPKDFDLLASLDRDLVRVIDFGWFGFIVVPLLRSLKGINAYVGNYGWAIIILTFLINAVFFPLRHKSFVSMQKMQKLQPEVKAIQERYKRMKRDDPQKQKMNVEIMNLYRERGVNPASGCLPMLLTFPILFAFYKLLAVAIELRGAPFIWWLRDLSQRDPYYVTPILMGVSMVVQQKMTPSAADPTQQKMMMFMPVMMTFLFLYAPSGLVVYWLVSNVLAIAQQQITNRLVGAPARPPAAAAAPARQKRA